MTLPTPPSPHSQTTPTSQEPLTTRITRCSCRKHLNTIAFNNTKLETLPIITNASTQPTNQPTTSYTAPDGNPMTNPSKVQKTLGVLFSSDATFSVHIATTANKVHSQLG
ncbi:hypothetical protein Pcinc_009534 [Petrolisthes cinctipes]|uniref:Uncharacterized protein n=1 Tax=Petrolisthes cinctipes TaxID=88211 RepID=A0AAE1G554_PETCI|nr:hypothetical protein Pcinc_009534 [Petrolisthes cinctipes]